MTTMVRYQFFPAELVEEILSRLPVRHLLRWRCVSKSWCALIDSYRFIVKHHQVQYAKYREEGDIPFLLDSSLNNSSEFFLLSKKGGDVVTCLTPDLGRDFGPLFTNDPKIFDRIDLLGVLNGVVCLRWHHEQLGLWNPATRELKSVPPPSLPDSMSKFRTVALGLGFNPKSNDFMILRFMVSKTADEETGGFKIVSSRNKMYSLSSNSWKSLEEPLPNLFVYLSQTDGYFNGVHYWCASQYNERGILSFDFGTETFKLFDPPPAGVYDYLSGILGQCMEQLAFFVKRDIPKEAINYSEYEIWVASRFEDNGMTLSWQHLYTVGFGPVPDLPGGYSVWPLAFRMDGDLLLIICSGEIEEWCLYNPSTHTFKKPRFGDSVLPVGDFCFRYVESLFPLTKRLQARSKQS